MKSLQETFITANRQGFGLAGGSGPLTGTVSEHRDHHGRHESTDAGHASSFPYPRRAIELQQSGGVSRQNGNEPGLSRCC